MLTHPTLEQLHQLGLHGMARAFVSLAADPEAAELTQAEWLGLLLDHEATDRQDRRLKARLRYARLRHQASIEDVDYRTARPRAGSTAPSSRRSRVGDGSRRSRT